MDRGSPQLGTAVAKPRTDNVPRGIAFIAGAVLLFSSINAAVKWLAEQYPIGEIVFFRSALALIPCWYLVWRAGGLSSLKTARPWMHVFRGTVWLASLTCTFISYHLLPLADAVAISFSAPLFVTTLSAPILGERVDAHRWIAVLVGFAGVLVMVRPGYGVMAWGALFALGSALFFAIGSLSIREMSRTETSAAIVTYTSLLASVLSLASAPFGWVAPSLADFLILAAIGVGGGVAQFWIAESFRNAPVAAVVPFTYTALVWAALSGWLIWGDVPGVGILIGAAIVIGSGLYLLLRESRRVSVGRS